MKNKNSMFYFLISIFLLFLAFAPNLKADVENNSLGNAQKLADSGIIQNNSSNPSLYKLDSSITRREMLKVMLNLAGAKPGETCSGKFADLNSSDWGCKYAEKGLDLGFLSANKNFRPNSPVSKAESLKMIFKAKNINVESTNDWRAGYVKKAYELGYSDNFFDYDAPAKRSFVFNVGAKIIGNNDSKTPETPNNSRDLMCLQVITYAKNQETGECVEFPNSCIPTGFTKVQSCEKKTSNNNYSLLFPFSGEMNKASVEKNIKIYPGLKYTSNWKDDKTLELTLNEEINKELDILVNVMDEATLKNGKKLDETLTKKYKIDGKATVDFVSPEGQLTDKNVNITVRFSKPIVNLTNLDNQEKCPITITPELPGKCVWITTSTFQFRPTEGFPAGARYSILIPAGVQSIAGDKTLESKVFEIVTPEFKLLSAQNRLKNDAKLNFLFNDNISLEDFKNNFSLSGIDKNNLNFEYLQIPTSIEGKYDSNKAGVSIFPKSGNWGYGKNYSYTLSSNMKSQRGNRSLNEEKSGRLNINNFLNEYSTVVINDKNAKEIYIDSNLIGSLRNTTIRKNNPAILFKFEKEVKLDKSLFSLNLPFTINYVKTKDYSDYNNPKIIEDKKQIIMEINGNIEKSLKIIVNTKEYGQESTELNFQTKEEDNIISYNQINYKKACIVTKNNLGNNINYKSFEFDKYGKISYISVVNQYSNDTDCIYESGKNKYIVETQLNPENDYKLTIKNTLLDADNYPLDKDYNYTFKTGPALNEDKSISIIDSRQNILVPKSIHPLTISLSSVNLNKANINICEGDFDITSEGKIKNEACKEKTINITNLGFKTNISVIDLKEIFGKEFTKNYITVEVSKLESDKTDYEKKNEYTENASFIISDISAVIKSGEKGVLWLRNFETGENLDNQIEKIESYKTENNYSIFGNYKGIKYTFDKNIDFSFIKNGLYQINKADGDLLITLKSKEKIWISNIPYNNNDRVYNYLSTDKPIYKAGESVNIKGLSRILTAKSYEIASGNVKIIVRDSKYKEIFNKEVLLNNLGAFEANLNLANDTSLGTYSISVGNNTLSFLVEEYEKPDFKIETNSRQKNYLNTQTALIDIKGDYYIGMPLSNGEGSYNITSNDYYFDGGKTSGYIWGENNYVWWRSSSNYSSSPNYKSGKFSLDQDGKYTLGIDGDANNASDKTYTVSTTITDTNTKKSISSNASFTSLRSNTFLGIKFDKYYYDFKDTANIGFASVDIDGNKKGNIPYNFKVYKVDYKYNESTYEYEESEKVVSEKSLTTDSSGLSNEKFTFDDYGEYRFEIETTDKKYKTTKTIYVSGGNVLRPIDAENKIEVLSDKDQYKVGENAEIVISSPVVGVKALVTIEKLNQVIDSEIVDITEFNQKETLTIKKEFLPNFDIGVYIIKDIKTNTDKLEELKNIRAEMLTIEQSLQKEESKIPIPYTIFDFKISPTLTNEDLDKDLLSKLATLRFKENSILNDILPKYYVGNKTIKVNTETVTLNASALVDKTSYLPGDKQIINLNITDNSGKPVTGQVTLKVIDESLLALKNNTVSIKDFFYSEVGNEINTSSNLSNIIKRIDFNKIEEEKGIGGAVPSTANYSLDGSENLNDLFGDLYSDQSNGVSFSMDKGTSVAGATQEEYKKENNSLESKIRTEFKDLAYYKGTIEVKDGKAQIIVDKLPDNLTTWVVSGFAYTSDTKVGEIETKFKVQKNLSILPQIPRFFTNGDIAKIGGLVVNNTSSNLNIEASLEMTNALISENKQNIQIPANSQKLVEFNVEVGKSSEEIKDDLDVKSSNIKLVVKNSDNSLSDTIVLSKPIYKENSGEYVFTNGSTNDLSYEEKINLPTYLDKDGYVEISLGASILTNLLQNVDKTLYFPGDDLYTKLIFLENSSILEKLYKNAGETDKFENIRVTDNDGKSYKISEVNELIKNDLKNYLQADNGLSYFKNCQTSYYYPSCSELGITGKYLSLGIEIPGIDNKNVVQYYKDELTKKIEKNKTYGILNTNIGDFLPLAVQKETKFINNYFKPSENLTNNEKLDYIKLYSILGTKGDKVDTYIRDLRNSIIIEARGTFLPSGEGYSYQNNSYSTALMLQTLLEKNLGDKLETENLARWLLSQRDEQGAYYIDSVSEILKALSLYVEKNEQLNNLNFEGKAFLNSKEIMSSKFNSENKFSIDKEKLPLEGNITFGTDNSLGFEKSGTGKLYYDVGVRYFLPTSKLEARDEGIIVSRNYYKYDDYKNSFKKDCFYPWWLDYSYTNYCIETKTKEINPIKTATKGDLIVGEVEITVTQERTNVFVNDFLPAGAEILNTNFDTTSDEAKDLSSSKSNVSFYYGFNYVEQKDNMVYLFANHLKPGTYKYTYVIKASYAGKYSLKPATAELLDKPEVWGRSNGSEFEIK